MSTAALPVAAPPAGLSAAAERIRQIQSLIARVEHPGAAPAANFASALNAASSGAAGSAAPTVAYPSAAPSAAGYPSALPSSAVAYPAAALSAAGYPSVAPPAAAYPSAPPGATGSGAAAAGAPAALAPLIEQAAARNGLSPALLSGLIRQESGFNPAARSSAGALGLTQLMPSTAASLGVTEPLDPAQSIEGGARYLAGMIRRFGGNTASALAAYNAGAGAVEQYGGVPPYPETQQYVAKVLAYAGTPSGAIA
jgi:soluble lytic murein transglycosylase-like protein